MQEFFEPFEIISQSEKNNDSYTNLVNSILDSLIDNNEELEEYNIRNVLINENNNYDKNKYNDDKIITFINNNKKEQK